MPSKKDYYGILGVDKSADATEVKKAYRQLVKQWHPDRHLENKEIAEEKFKEIQEAYEVLSDPEKRKLYDRFGFVPEGGMPNQGGGVGVEDIFRDFFGGGSSSGGGGGFGDIFDQFFGGGGGSSRGGQRRENAPQKGSDIHVRITLDLKDILYETKKKIEYDRTEQCHDCKGTGAKGGSAFKTCPRCHGQGQINEEQRTFFGTFVKSYECPTCSGKGKIIEDKCNSCNGTGKNKKTEKISLTIPAGIEDGFRERIRGRGHAGKNGGPNGDLILLINVKSDRRFNRKGADLETEITINYVTAALGGKVKIPTLEGDITENIPEGTNPGSIIRLKNLGLPSFNGRKRGDIYVKINVEIPKPSMKEKKYLKEIAKAKNIDL